MAGTLIVCNVYNYYLYLPTYTLSRTDFYNWTIENCQVYLPFCSLDFMSLKSYGMFLEVTVAQIRNAF